MTAPTVEALQYLLTAVNTGLVSAFMTQNNDGTLTIMVDVGPPPGETTLAPLVGPEGAAGPAQFPLIPQKDIYTDPKDLPTIGTLTNTAADIGKFWIITQYDDNANIISVGAYIWFGTQYRFLPFGVQGPPGPYGIIQPYIELLPPDQQSQLLASGDGDAANPYLAKLQLSIPQGPFGRCMPLAEFPDVIEGAVPPTVGEFLVATGTTIEHGGHALPVWAPAEVVDVPLLPYTVPLANFNHVFGIEFNLFGFATKPATICTFMVPAQPWPWKPVVFGQIKMFEIELSFSPLEMGIEVYLGSPTGTLVARGFGNTLSGVVNIVPHTSSATSPTTAMTPWNEVGLVPANTSGIETTLFVNVVNDGILAIYDYNPLDAELLVMACPAIPVTQPGIVAVVGPLATKMTLSAKNITQG
jgi:hypothetical protein